MTRVKRGVLKRKRRKKIIKLAKGFKWRRKSNFRLAKEALMHAWTYAYRDRKAKKRTFRRLWQLKINAACREKGISYSKFISSLKKKGIGLDKKILAEIAEKYPEVFERLLEEIK